MRSLEIPQLLGALRQVLPERAAPYALHEPVFAGQEWSYVKECIDTGWVSSAGEYVGRFEAALADYTGVGAAVALVNGTSALHMALLAAGVRPGDEVLLPALTFVATANAVRYCGATPHFVDSEECSLGVDAVKLETYLKINAKLSDGHLVNLRTGQRISALVAMHTFGHPADLDRLADLCRGHRIPLVEDAAESLGSLYRGHHTGSHGVISALSFNGNKIVTTGGGGALITNDRELARRMRHLTTTAKQAHAWEFMHDQTGYNYRLPNINAALGCAQMEQLPGFVERKRCLAQRYAAAIKPVAGLRFFVEPGYARSNYWLNAIILDKASAPMRDDVLTALHRAGILARPVWKLMNHLPMYRDCPRMDLSCAQDLAASLINLPSGMGLEPAHG